jgi:Cu(I)/Ag(I) efflux system membrane fusion protein
LKEGDRVVNEGGLILDGQAQLARAAVTGVLAEPAQGATTPTVMTVSAADEAAYPNLKTLALAAADAATVLAADDFAGYQKLLPTLRTALEAYLKGLPETARSQLAKFRNGLPDRPDLRAARRDFEPLSTALADVAAAQHVQHRESLHVFQCPMSPVLGTGRWLSRTTQVRNPFFGSAMLECGDELK